MNKVSRTITGIVMILIGLGLVTLPVFINEAIFVLIYGLPILIIGIIILFNKNEDIIEEIQMKGGKKHK